MGPGFRFDRWAVACVCAATLAACGGEEGEEDNAIAAGDANRVPIIAGSPRTSVEAGSAYSFRPTGRDDDGDPLIFGVDGKPSWLDFDQVTGMLSGTPETGDIGMHRGIVVWVSDGKDDALLPAFDVNVMPASSPPNAAPTIDGQPGELVTVDESYDFVPTVFDSDGDALTFEGENLPPWTSLDANTGRLSGTPSADDVGVYDNILISVSDGSVSAVLDPFQIIVNPQPTSNSAPTIMGVPDPSVLEGAAYSFLPTATDSDGDTLTFLISNRPPWADFDSTTGELSGTPGDDDVGVHPFIRIRVSDGTAVATLPTFSITVESTNTAPTISGTPPSTGEAGVGWAFVPEVFDPDGDDLSFGIQNRPGWASFNASTGRLAGTPSAAGSHTGIVITVDDGEATDALGPFSITVLEGDVNGPPTIDGQPPDSITQNSPYSFTPSASDPDGDSLTFGSVNLPGWLTMSDTNGHLEGTPTSADVGTYTGIRITVSDGDASDTLGPFSITVMALANGTATLTWTPPTQNTDGSPLTNLAGYIVHWGTASGDYASSVTIENSGVTSYVVENLLSGTTYYFATRAYNTDGLQSGFSNEATKTIP